jgi:hypothetical protein
MSLAARKDAEGLKMAAVAGASDALNKAAEEALKPSLRRGSFSSP